MRVLTLDSMALTQNEKLQLESELTIKETAQYFRVTTRTIRNWISQSKLMVHRYSLHTVRIPKSSIEKFQKRSRG